eukprot:2166478-Prymnesium_polylepis.1
MSTQPIDPCASNPSAHALQPIGQSALYLRSLLARLLVVGRVLVGDELARAVRVDVARHVVGHRHHIGAHLVEARRGDHVALAVDLRHVAGACVGWRVSHKGTEAAWSRVWSRGWPTCHVIGV